MKHQVVPLMRIMMHAGAKSALRMIAEQKIGSDDTEINIYLPFRSAEEASIGLRNVTSLFGILEIDPILQQTPQHHIFIGTEITDISWQKLDVAARQMKILQRAYDAGVLAQKEKRDGFSIVYKPHYGVLKDDMDFLRATFAEYVLQPAIKGDPHNGSMRAYFLGQDLETTVNYLGPTFKSGRVKT